MATVIQNIKVRLNPLSQSIIDLDYRRFTDLLSKNHVRFPRGIDPLGVLRAAMLNHQSRGSLNAAILISRMLKDLESKQLLKVGPELLLFAMELRSEVLLRSKQVSRLWSSACIQGYFLEICQGARALA